MNRPVFYYDSDCGVCSWLARLARRLDRADRLGLRPLTSPEADLALAHLTMEQRFSSSYLVLPNGRILSRARGMAEGVGILLPLLRPLLRLPFAIPGMARALDRFYDWFAANRYRFSKTCGLERPPDL